MDKNKKRILKTIQDYVAITLGLFIYVCGWVLFLWPKKIMGGGVSGIASLMNYATSNPDGTGGISVSVVYLAINAVFVVLGIKILGKGFGAKTIYAIAITTIFFTIVPQIIPHEIIQSLSEKNSDLICAIMGGAFAGAGIGISFNSGGSSGGTDIIALIISKYRNVSPGRVILYLDLIIIGSSYILSKDITQTLYGYVVIAVVGYTIDLMISGEKQSLQIFIFSKKYTLIADRLTMELGRGVTAIDAKGWYTKESGIVLMTVVRKYEAGEVYRIVKEEDSNAFLSVSNAMGVFGQGFDAIKGKRKVQN